MGPKNASFSALVWKRPAHTHARTAEKQSHKQRRVSTQSADWVRKSRFHVPVWLKLTVSELGRRVDELDVLGRLLGGSALHLHAANEHKASTQSQQNTHEARQIVLTRKSRSNGCLSVCIESDLGDECLAQGEHALDGTDDSSLDHEEVLVDLTVLHESSQRGDGLLSEIGRGGSVVLVRHRLVLLLVGIGRDAGVGSSADAIDLLVDLGTVMVTVLTSARDLESNASRVPSTDTSDLAQTSVRLARQASHTPTVDHTGVSMT